MARITSTLLLLMLFGCGENIQHDTDLAARRAVEFAELAFVRQNLEKSHLLLADSARSYVPLDKFRETIVKSHPSGYPTRVTAVRAEPVKGEKAVYVLVRGEASSGNFQYSLTLTGTAASDYRVTIFHGGRSS
jgi:hypothetical protein